MNRRFIIFIALFMILYVSIAGMSGLYIDYSWFKANQGTGIFWTLFSTKFYVHVLFMILFTIIFFLNFILIRYLGGPGKIFNMSILDRLQIPVIGTPRRMLIIIIAGAVLFLGLILGSAAASYWKEYLMFRHAIPFEGFPNDPIFNKNIGFYVFSLPFYQFLYSWLMSVLLIITAFSLLLHFLNGGILIRNARIEFSLFARTHISILLAAIVALLGIGYRISAYELLFSRIGKFYGPGYTAVNASLVAYNVAMGISFIAAALLFFNIIKKSFKLPVMVMATLIPAYFLIGTVYPSLQQRFIVEPNELDKEKPYIENHIRFTRLAYDIERIKELKFENKKNLTWKKLQKNRSVIKNIRLWDWRPLKQTYKQLQELKPYYFFNDVDVDRYIINNQKIAVNLAARELSIDKISSSSQTWQNSHLIYTHGYGLVLSRVDQITSEGQPEMLIYDIPPKSKLPVKVTQPQIYYGEHKNSYVITGTSISPGEFDYPYGDENKYTTYTGDGGIQLDSLFKRIMFSAAFKDINILISRNINSKSRILYRRNINEITRTLTPFLYFDDDPYLVLSKGKLYWILDGYTLTDKFPYSTPLRVSEHRFNYIRNSVKVVIDAYTGKVQYYISKTNDPLIRVYSKIFPGFFKEISEMDEDLQTHLRYPEDIFNIQSHMLLKYHMTNANVFYNNEDAWHIPRQIYEDKEEPVQSYYLVTKLPDEKEDEFILIMPFTPFEKNNMIAFLAAKCDQKNYGELKLYTLPKDKLSYGPLQVEARIDQNPEISKQLSLWSQKGSSVIRGNMLVLPIEESLMFIEPLYLKAESSEMPELKRVIVSFNDKIVMEKDLSSALEKLFFGISESMDESLDSNARIQDLALRAYNYYIRAEQHMRNGNWKSYGEELEKLKSILTLMKNME